MSMNSFHARKSRPAAPRTAAAKPAVARQGVRADVRLVELGLATSRADARRLIEAGRVAGPNGAILKPSQELPSDGLLTLLEV